MAQQQILVLAFEFREDQLYGLVLGTVAHVVDIWDAQLVEKVFDVGTSMDGKLIHEDGYLVVLPCFAKAFQVELKLADVD